jgi:hypothetical protein
MFTWGAESRYGVGKGKGLDRTRAVVVRMESGATKKRDITQESVRVDWVVGRDKVWEVDYKRNYRSGCAHLFDRCRDDARLGLRRRRGRGPAYDQRTLR